MSKAARGTPCTLLLLGCVLSLAGCTSGGSGKQPAPAATVDHADHADHGTAAPGISNRIDVPESVRQNLGITFARVERRAVARTRRVPGRFEPQPFARREYHAAVPGQVELLVRQYQSVTTGTPLYRLDSPEWRKMQQALAEAEAAVRSTSAALVLAQISRRGSGAAADLARRRLEADERHDESVRQAMAVAQQRLQQLEKLQKQVGGLQTELAQARAQVAEARTAVAKAEEERAELEQQYLQLQTESSGSFGTSASLETALAARASEYEAARLKLKLARSTARAMLRLERDSDLDRPVTEPGSAVAAPLWQTIQAIEVRALAPGVVQTVDVAPGSFVEGTSLVMTTLDPGAIRFRGTALQSDLPLLAHSTEARIVAPEGGGLDPGTSLRGTIQLAVEAHPEQRTVDVVVDVVREDTEELPVWARAGVAAEAEITVAGSEDPELAIPAASVVQDDLTRIFFRRDPKDPDKVIRVEADLGTSDGRWVVVNSGLRDGDEVVLSGVYELKLTGSGKAPEGGHFHADGTWHAGND